MYLIISLSTLHMLLHLAVIPASSSADNRAFLLHTLRTHVLFACENEYLSIKCPVGATISIDSANYGRQLPNSDMCPYRWSAGGINSTDLVVPESEDTNCRAASSLPIVLSSCQNQETCTLRVTNEIFQEDPCPGTHKYLDVTYKCSPNEFESLIVCEHRHMQLHCEGANIIAIYSASFGRTELGSMECPSYTMHEIECQSESTLEAVMKRCHGRRNCAVKAATKVFGDPCPKGTHKYLNVVYSCVSRKVFRKPRRYVGLPRVRPERPVGGDEDSPTQVVEVISPQLKGTGIEMVDDSLYSVMEPAVTDYITEVFVTEAPGSVNGWVYSSIAMAHFIMDNKYTVLLALLLGAAVGLILMLLGVIVHCQMRNWKLRRKLENVTKRHNLGSGDGLLLAVQEENRIDVDELWRRPPSPLILTNRVFDNQNGSRARSEPDTELTGNAETNFGPTRSSFGPTNFEPTNSNFGAPTNGNFGRPTNSNFGGSTNGNYVPVNGVNGGNTLDRRTMSVSDSHSTIHQVEIDSNRNTIQRAQRPPSDSTTVSWHARTFAPSNRSTHSNRSNQELDSNRSTLPRVSREPSEVTTYHNEGTLPLPGNRSLNNFTYYS